MATTTSTETIPFTTTEAKTTHQTQWLKPTGVLDQYDSFDVTPIIGREFPNASIREWLEAPNSDELLKDLAVTISQRGVVFFRKQVNSEDYFTTEIFANYTQQSHRTDLIMIFKNNWCNA